MSIRAIQAVWDRSEKGGSIRLLLLALADFADEEGYAWPSVATLAERTGRTERQVRRLIGIAIDAGELQADRGGGRGTSRYRVTPGGVEVGGNPTWRPPRGGRTSTSAQPGRPLHPTEDTGDRAGGTPMTAEPLGEPPAEPPADPAREVEETRVDYLESGQHDPIVRYHELTHRFPTERIREWINDVASTWGDERTAGALTEAFSRDNTHRGLISRAVDVMNEQEHEVERANRRAREIVGAPEQPEQSDEERERVMAQNAERARTARAALLADGLVHPTRPGDEELMKGELARREGQPA